MIKQHFKKYALAGIFIRITSGMVDLLLAILLWFLIHTLLVKNLVFPSWFIRATDLLFLPVLFSYFIICEWRFGRTIGKMLCRIESVSDEKTRMAFSTSFVRSLCRLISIGLFFSGYLMIIFRRDKKALHDLISGTKVIYSQKK